MHGCMTYDFMPFSTVFKSKQDDVWMIIKGSFTGGRLESRTALLSVFKNILMLILLRIHLWCPDDLPRLWDRIENRINE